MMDKNTEKITDEQALEYLHIAMEDAKKGYTLGEGGPFGAVIVKDGVIISVAHNSVLKNNDPTAHAEVMAIRKACEKLQTYDLSGSVIFATGEPCPMCASAIIWANISKCYFANTVKDAERIGFRDDKIYKYFAGKTEILNKIHLPDEDCLHMYDDYRDNYAKIY